MSSLSQASHLAARWVKENAPAIALHRPSLPACPKWIRSSLWCPASTKSGTCRAVVGQLVRQVRPEKLLIVIVDGASTDGTARIARDLAAEHGNVRYLYDPGRLQSIAVNLAVREFGEGFRYLAGASTRTPTIRPTIASICFGKRFPTAADSVAVVSMRTIGKGTFQVATAAAQNRPSAMANPLTALRRLTAAGSITGIMR